MKICSKTLYNKKWSKDNRNVFKKGDKVRIMPFNELLDNPDFVEVNKQNIVVIKAGDAEIETCDVDHYLQYETEEFEVTFVYEKFFKNTIDMYNIQQLDRAEHYGYTPTLILPAFMLEKV